MGNTAKSYTLVGSSPGHFFFTAEHASNHIPVPHLPVETSILQSHWAYDIGIKELMVQLCHQLCTQGIASTLSRLWIDTNRAPTQEGLIKSHVEEYPLSFNHNLSPKEREKRQQCHHDYHFAIEQHLQNFPSPPILVSLHSFTPIWNNHIRTMDIGLLFDRDEHLAFDLAHHLQKQGYFVAYNQPYSGKNGLIYSADRHGRTFSLPYVELEFNQSILSSKERIERVAKDVAFALSQLDKKMYIQDC